MPSPKELAAGLKAQEATSPNSKVMFVGQEHGKKTVLPDNVKKMAEKYGAYYEGAGGDKSDAVKYQGSWDDKASKEVKGYPKEFLYTLFTNSNVNNQKKNLTQPDKTIFDSALAAQDKWGYFKDRKFDADTLKQFLSASGMLDKSKQPATESNVKKFIDEGEGLMWPKNWEEYPNPAGKLAQKASEYRTNWLKSQKEGVYFVGSDHMKELNKPKEPAPSQLAKALAYRGEIRNTPQNSFLGGVANFLAPVSEFADQYKISDRIPFLGGMSAADLTGLKGAQSLVNDMSYGKSPISGASLQTAKVDPRLLDLAAVSGAMIPVGKALGKAALREGARQIETGTGVIGSKVMNPKMSAVPEGITSRQVRELIDKNSPGESLDFDALRSAIGGNSYKLTDYDIGKINFGDLSVDASKAMPSKGPIVIGKDGKIIDGRHRAALAKSMGDSHIKAYVPVGDNVGGAMMQRPKTEFEILHDTAQRNAALPKEQGGLGLPEGNTGMDRAAAMDWNTPAYHGSGEELRVINNEKLKRNAYGKGLHSASDPELANIFANHSSQGQNVSPLLLRVGNQASKEDYKNAMNQVWDQGGHDATKIRQLLIDKGFDTVTYNHGDFHYPQGAGLVKSLPNQDLSYATLNPSQVRSRFAAFDPMRRHEADILAGVGVGGMLDPQAIAEALRQQDRK